MTTFFSASQDAPDFTNNVLVLPTLSVGKVGGLTVDLLAATYGLPRVGWLEDENVLPVASNDTLTLLPRPDGALSTNLEVFQDVANRVTYVQQRAPVIRLAASNRHVIAHHIIGSRSAFIQNRNAAFVQNLFQWVKEARFREVVLLSSVDSARRIAEAQFHDRHAITCRYVVGGGAEPKSSRFKWPLLEEGSFDSAFKNTSFTHLAFDACKREGLAATILTIFCADGVNIPHAFAMADAAFHYLDLSHPQTSAAPASEEEKAKPPRWRPPTSWHHLFEMASSFDATLFG